MDYEAVKNYLLELQSRIVVHFEKADGKQFRVVFWDRPLGGGGISCVIEEGQVFERGGVNFSHVHGEKLPPSATASRPELAGRSFDAMGVSVVMHPRNPYVPTVHLNVRFLCAHPRSSEVGSDIWWFGGGMDLTPCYGFEEDCVHFHQTCKDALASFDPAYYPRFKKWCDEYFFIKHRNEPRGIGGIFFDDFNELDFDKSFKLVQCVGNNFLPAYLPILERHVNAAYGDQERDFQSFRRGRYVEFNLVYDRGTLFGLQSGGRAESILISLPPNVKWRYDWKPEPKSPEEKLYKEFLIARNWVN